MMEAVDYSEMSVPSIEPQGLTSQEIIIFKAKETPSSVKVEGLIYPLLKYGSASKCLLLPAPFTVRLFLKYRIKDGLSANLGG
jgi:hypothetical protein